MLDINRMNELIEILNKASYFYHQENESIISDKEFDCLYDELKKLEEKTQTVLSNSPTKKVGYEIVSNLTKIKHETKVLSLDKTKDLDELASWLGDNEGLLSWKLDGLTVILKYNNGELIQAITRGNGIQGEDITHNAKVFSNIPLKINYKNELVIRGEAVISFSNFEKINSKLFDNLKYKNARNLASGSIRQLDSKIANERYIEFYVFQLVKPLSVNTMITKIKGLSWLKDLGFSVVETTVVNKVNLTNVFKTYKERLEVLNIPTDGLVLTYNDMKYSESLGTTAKFPRDSMAFKWEDECAETTLREVEWNTSRTGLINPVAIFDPVELEGTTVERASIHNISIIKQLELGIGDIIQVYKANMIIPQIDDNFTRSNTLEIPNKCPSCGSEAIVKKEKDSEFLYCSNDHCPSRILFSLNHFCSRDAANIKGLSEARLEKFIDEGFISNCIDIFELSQYRKDIIKMNGFGEKSCDNLLKAIEAAKDIELPNFIYALGINMVGLANAKLLCKSFDNDLNKIMTASVEDLLKINSFGEVIAKEITEYFKSEDNIELINELQKHIRFIKDDNEKTEIQENSSNGKVLENMIFVITGSLINFKNRKQLQAFIEKQGGSVKESISSKTSYLINNDITSTSGKNRNAKSLNVPIISEEDFLNIFNFN